MSVAFAESNIEEAALAWLAGLGYSIKNGHEIAPDSHASERANYGDVILRSRLAAAIDHLNHDIPEEVRAEAVRRVEQAEYPGLVEENRRLHTCLVEGLPVEFYGEDGVLKGDNVRLIDFDDPANNDWLALNQFTVIEHQNNRRPDVVVFVNGLPVPTRNLVLIDSIDFFWPLRPKPPSLFPLGGPRLLTLD